MGTTATPTLLGGAVGTLKTVSKNTLTAVPVEFKMSNSYATGGDTWAGPTADVRGQELQQLDVTGSSDPTRCFYWDGSKTTPKVKAESRAGVEVTAATDLSAVTVYGIAWYQ
jgi:hypothetical protein